MEMDNTRTLFTNHGLHMNTLGKQLITCQIATFLHSIFEPKKSPPISLGWYELQSCNYLVQEDNEKTLSTRNSSRNKRLPATTSGMKFCLYRKHCVCFLTWMFYREGLLALRPTPEAGGPWEQY